MRHVTEDEISRALGGAASPAESNAVLAHLLECPVCATRSEDLIQGFGNTRTGALLRDCLDLGLDSAVAMLLADLQWAEIRGWAVKAQKERIATAGACKTPLFTRILLGELTRGESWKDNEELASVIAASINSIDETACPLPVKNALRAELMMRLRELAPPCGRVEARR